MKKILIIRFSSIGDIVLTTPVIRCLKKQYPSAEIHFLTKRAFSAVLESNPYLSKVWSINKEVSEIAENLKLEKFDHVIDLHKNIRSKQVKFALKVPFTAFRKLNYQKWLLTNFKINKMPDIHIVDRYMETVKSLDVKNDNLGLDFFIQSKNEIDLRKDYIALVVGAAHATKALTVAKAVEIIEKIPVPVILVGGPADKDKGEQILAMLDGYDVVNSCGQYNLEQSASVLKNAKVVITPDTGMMHIASALQTPVISIWGNTVPEFGMYPYMPQRKSDVHIVEVTELNCRPCSKIGYPTCPKKHFNCMELIDVLEVEKILKSYL